MHIEFERCDGYERRPRTHKEDVELFVIEQILEGGIESSVQKLARAVAHLVNDKTQRGHVDPEELCSLLGAYDCIAPRLVDSPDNASKRSDSSET